MITRFEGTCVLRCYQPTKASDPSALAAAEDIGRAKRVPRLAVRRARESCIVFRGCNGVSCACYLSAFKRLLL